MAPSISNADIDRALAAGDIYCVFQPRIDLNSGDIRGAESLVRWTHPEFGTLPPRLFLPHIAHQGRMHELTARVIDCALGTANRCVQLGLNLTMHVNLSAQDFAFPGTEAAFAIRLRRYGLDPKHLRLELSEHDLAQLTHAGQARLGRLLQDGFTLAMQGLAERPTREDDNLPISEMQVVGRDAISLAGALQDTGSGRINGLVRMAKRLGRTMTAIGLETPQDVETAKALGFDTATGRAIAPPLGEHDFLEWATARSSASDQPLPITRPDAEATA